MLSPSGGCRRRISQEGGGSGVGSSVDLRALWTDCILTCLESRKLSIMWVDIKGTRKSLRGALYILPGCWLRLASKSSSALYRDGIKYLSGLSGHQTPAKSVKEFNKLRPLRKVSEQVVSEDPEKLCKPGCWHSSQVDSEPLEDRERGGQRNVDSHPLRPHY